ncbi:hypothetical protein [Halovivax gelatinilyticus]|uniref:hypothetical protein n=1 Tax=Halovivax gelatinilyticus TaxID=2961597 RepID=UPI0020CA9590|nr:hypothetical protein [Halovivax gelatinilyticus]
MSVPAQIVTNGTVQSSIENDTHTFEFSGEFTEFDVDGDVEVSVDGEPFDVASFPHNSITVAAPSGTEIDISASGRINPADGGEGITRINSRRITGEISGRTTFEYAGEITYFESTSEVRSVRKNGDRISVDEILPSGLPGDLRISGERDEVTVRTSADIKVVEGTSETNEDGAISVRPGGTDVLARFDGNIKEIAHESGATIEFVPENMRIVCSAPEGETVEFGAEATGGVVHDRTRNSETTVSVEGGESKQIKYYGDVTSVAIAGVDLSIDADAHKDAIASSKLQNAAVFERTEEYETIAADVDGRIRHDATSLYYRSTAGGGAKTLVIFQITDTERGDHGLVNLARSDETWDVTNAGYELIWEADDGHPEAIELSLLGSATDGIETANTFETRTFERGAQLSEAQMNANSGKTVNLFDGHDEINYDADSSPQWISLPSLPSPGDIIDYFGSALDSLASEIGIAKGTVAEITSDAIAAAEERISDAAEDLAIQGLSMIVDSQELLIELVAAAQDQLPRSRFWDFMRKVTPNFAGTVLDLGDAGVFDELADNNFGCAGCLAIILLTAAVAITATSSAICLAMISSFIFAASCGFFFAELLSFLDNTAGFSQWGAESFCEEVAGRC